MTGAYQLINSLDRMLTLVGNKHKLQENKEKKRIQKSKKKRRKENLRGVNNSI